MHFGAFLFHQITWVGDSVSLPGLTDLNHNLQDTMMMGADYYQTEAERAASLAEGKVPIGVGQDTKIM